MADNSEAFLNGAVEVELADDTAHHPVSVSISLLQRCAPNFAKVFSHPNVRGIKLHDVSWKPFCIFLGWLRTEYDHMSALPEAQEESDSIDHWMRTHGHRFTWYNCTSDPIILSYTTVTNLWGVAEVAIDLYFFAKKFDIPRLQQDAVDRLIWCNNKGYNLAEPGRFVSTPFIHRVYEHTDLGDPLRKWLIVGFQNFFNSSGEALPQRFLVDIAENYRIGPPERNHIHSGSIDAPCEFHEHGEQVGCNIRVNMDRVLSAFPHRMESNLSRPPELFQA